MTYSTETMVKPRTDLQEPPKFKVIYVNDNKTSMSFVIESVVDYFDYSVSDAEHIANTVHTKGSAIVAILGFEMAEQKGIEVTLAARAAGFPLQVRIEKEGV